MRSLLRNFPVNASLRIGAINIETMRSEPGGEEIAAGVRLVHSMAITQRTLVAEARRPNQLVFGVFALVTFI